MGKVAPRYLDLLLLLEKIEKLEKKIKRNGKKIGKTAKKKASIAQYKWIKHMYATLDKIEGEIKELKELIWNNWYQLSLEYGKLARRIKKLEEEVRNSGEGN